ncbi:MAG: GNAT family N-acetyltransferase [Flavobacteriia bacterium]|nr:MAG: GNAT family N-acetyltransferase [Flavobacteriia bacterium]
MIRINFITPEEAVNIRKIVLRKNIELPSEFKGDHDQDTFHLGLFYIEQLVCVVSFMKNNHPDLKGNQYQLRGMATLEEFQKKGLGKLLIEHSEKILQERNAGLVWCNARVKALNFYKKQGFLIYGKQFEIPLIGGHYVMYKPIL